VPVRPPPVRRRCAGQHLPCEEQLTLDVPLSRSGAVAASSVNLATSIDRVLASYDGGEGEVRS
jgi:hypothetical protein